MVPKRKRTAGRRTAIGLSAMALAAIALVPVASAATTTSTGLFGVQSKDTAGHSGYAGLAKPTGSNPGGGTVDPGTGTGPTTDPGTGTDPTPDPGASTGPTTEPATCAAPVADPTGYRSVLSYSDYSNYFTPQSGSTSSDWLDEVQAVGGTVKVGKPKVVAPVLYITRMDSKGKYTYDSMSNVDITDIAEAGDSTLSVAAKNTGVASPDYSTDEDREAFKHTSFKQLSEDRVGADAVASKLGNSSYMKTYGDDVIGLMTYDINVSYPVSVVWKATGEKPSCESTSTPVEYTDYTAQ